MWRRRLIALAGVILTVVAGYAAWTIYRAQKAVGESAIEVELQREIPHRTRALPVPAPAGWERISASASFQDAAVYQDKIWVLSPDGVFVYSQDGALEKRYLTGPDLPPAPLVAMAATATARGQGSELFIATRGEGLLIFNGSSWRQERPEQAPRRKLTALLPLDTGRLLIGTERAGIMAFDGERFTLFHEGLAEARVTALAGTLDNLWIGTMDQGVWRLHAGQIDRHSLPDPHVLSLAFAGEETWAGTALGVTAFRAGKISRQLAEGVFASALLAAGDRLMIGTLEEGLLDLPLAPRARPARAGLDSPPKRVNRILEAGGLTMAVSPDSLWLRSGAGWRKYIAAEPALLTDSNIAALAVEPAGRLWAGYFDRGLDVIDPGASAARHFEDDHLFCVNRIVPQPGGAIIATANGLVLADSSGKPRQVLGRDEGFIANHVTDVVVEPGGMVVATPAGITFFSRSGAQSIYAFHGLVNNHVYALARNGSRMLAGTLGGASLIDGGEIKASFTNANSGLRHNWITALAAVGGDWFAGTYGAGVLRFDGTQWHGFPDLLESFEVNPNALAVSDAAVYAGTLGRGLAIYNRASSRWAFHLVGLPSSNVSAVTAAGGYLYIGTDNGLVRVPERNLPLP
jgi:ligand-binding sensor domain-containing protein